MNERIYFRIDEVNAKMAHDMMSMKEYIEGSTTAAYRSEVDKVYKLADKVAEERPAEAERAYWLAEHYAKKMADYYNRDSAVGMMCPSILICGAGNFPTRRKERQVAAWERNHQFYNEIQSISRKIEAILNGKDIIKSDDEKAIEKLEEKLEDLKKSQERMTAANKALRIKDTERGDDELRGLGFSEEDIKLLQKPFCGRTGYASFDLTNNNAKIHRIEDRIKRLKAAKEKGTTEKENEFCRIVENTEAMRIQLFFDGKPGEKVRDILKSNGFKWSPRNECWQRQLTANGKWACERALKQIRELQTA